MAKSINDYISLFYYTYKNSHFFGHSEVVGKLKQVLQGEIFELSRDWLIDDDGKEVAEYKTNKFYFKKDGSYYSVFNESDIVKAWSFEIIDNKIGFTNKSLYSCENNMAICSNSRNNFEVDCIVLNEYYNSSEYLNLVETMCYVILLIRSNADNDLEVYCYKTSDFYAYRVASEANNSYKGYASSESNEEYVDYICDLYNGFYFEKLIISGNMDGHLLFIINFIQKPPYYLEVFVNEMNDYIKEIQSPSGKQNKLHNIIGKRFNNV